MIAMLRYGHFNSHLKPIYIIFKLPNLYTNFNRGWITSNDVVVNDLDIQFSVKQWVYVNTRHTY